MHFKYNSQAQVLKFRVVIRPPDHVLTSLAPVSRIFPTLFAAISRNKFKMADTESSRERGYTEDEREVAPEKAWRRIYRANKGAFLILMAEAVATSMDAIVRFLQQGGGGRSIHPFQVR